MSPLKPIIKILKLNRYGGVFATKLVKITKKYPEPIHPKHLLKIENPWYLEYINDSDTILDIGCDNASHTINCSRNCRSIIGFDYNDNSIKIANNRIKRNGIKNATIIRHDAEKKFPFKKNIFDKVMFLDTLEHLNNRDFVLSEIKKVLKNDGTLFVSIPNVNTSWKKLQKRVGLNPYCDPDHKIEYTKESIRKELANNGFRITKMENIIYDTPLAGIIDLTGGISLLVYKKLLEWKKRMVIYRPNDTTGFRIIAK